MVGPCPFIPRDRDAVCIADHPSCEYDAECSGVNHKCCMNPNCRYRECVDMNKVSRNI